MRLVLLLTKSLLAPAMIIIYKISVITCDDNLQNICDDYLHSVNIKKVPWCSFSGTVNIKGQCYKENFPVWILGNYIRSYSINVDHSRSCFVQIIV